MTIALVLGGARLVRREARKAQKLFTPDLVVAVNDVGTTWDGPLDLWVTLHPVKMAGWVAERKANGLPGGFATVTFPVDEHPSGTHADRDGFDLVEPYLWPDQGHSGSSGLYAVKVALTRVDKAVLAGIPIDKGVGHIGGAVSWPSADAYKRGWNEALQHIRERVRSMSGWTAELLGEPTRDWVES